MQGLGLDGDFRTTQKHVFFGDAKILLKGGLTFESSLPEVKSKVANLQGSDRWRQHYVTGESRVKLSFSQYSNVGDGDEAFKISSITIEKKALAKPEREEIPDPPPPPPPPPPEPVEPPTEPKEDDVVTPKIENPDKGDLF